MREVNFVRDVVYPIAHLLDIDTEHDYMRDHARVLLSSINGKVRHGWGFWPWPEIELTEERAFRQIWHSDVDYQAGQGANSELYYIPNQTYYRVIGNPPIGAIPPDNVAVDLDVPGPFFEEITPDLLDRHLAYEQYGKQDIDRVISIHPENPRACSCAELLWAMAPSGFGLDLQCAAGPTVWVTFIPRPPEFTSSTYDPARYYVRGDLVLDLETGDCSRALLPGTGKSLTFPAYWLRQQMPYVISEYVKYAAAAEQAGDAQTKINFQTTAANRLYDEIDKLIVQGQRFRYQPRRALRAA